MIDLSNVKYVSPEAHEPLGKLARARRGDILLSKNGTIGIVKVVNWEIHECVTGQRRITDADLRKMNAAAILPADASLDGGTNQ